MRQDHLSGQLKRLTGRTVPIGRWPRSSQNLTINGEVLCNHSFLAKELLCSLPSLFTQRLRQARLVEHPPHAGRQALNVAGSEPQTRIADHLTHCAYVGDHH